MGTRPLVVLAEAVGTIIALRCSALRNPMIGIRRRMHPVSIAVCVIVVVAELLICALLVFLPCLGVLIRLGLRRLILLELQR